MSVERDESPSKFDGGWLHEAVPFLIKCVTMGTCSLRTYVCIMYVCMYMYVCYVCVCVYVCKCMYVCMYTVYVMYVYMFMYVCVCIYLCM
jgi:hypothetical protein